MAITAPGVLLALALLTFALIAAPWLSSLVLVASSVRATGAVLLLAHGLAAMLVLKRGGQWPAAVAFLAVLAVDAFGAGILFGADLRMYSPGIAFCLAVFVMSLMAGGATVGLACVLTATVGIGAAQVGGLPPLVVSPAEWFPMNRGDISRMFP